MNLADQIMADEGYVRYAYICPAGDLTIGYGRNISENGPGISETEARILLGHDLAECDVDMGRLFTWDFWTTLDMVRRNALTNMRYQLGPAGFRGFRNMIAAIKHKQWGLAAQHALDSRWAVQTPRRAQRIAEELRDGVALS